MKTKIFKPIKRFWRGLTKRMRIAVILLSVSALLLAGFGIYMLVRPAEAADEATATLFPAVDRDGIASVLCHTVHGTEYTVKSELYTVANEVGDPQMYRRFYIMDGKGKEYGLLTLNSTQLSSFVVGTGKNYVYSPVISAPESGDPEYGEKLSAYEAKKKELGFGEDSPYYELTTTAGEVYRVYYGRKDVTGAGYYVLLAGQETIYATKSAFIGDLLSQTGPESLIDSTIFISSQNKYAYAYPQKYSIYDFERIDDEGTVVTKDAYSVGYHLKDENGNYIEGNLPLEPYEGSDEANRLYREAVIEFFVGKEVGKCNETFTFTYPPDNEKLDKSLRGKTVSIEVATIDHITMRSKKLELKYLPMRQREASQKLSVYAYTAPSDITSYIPDSDFVLSMLEDVLALKGTVVKLGLDDAVISEYGLYEHQIWIRYPGGSTISAAGSVNVSKEDADAIAEEEFFKDDSNFLEGRIYVSGETERGTRYVASMFYDIVVEVDAATLKFLDQSPLEFVDDFVMTAPITDVDTFKMSWNYGEGKWLSGSYAFDATVEKVQGGFTGEYDEKGQPKYQYNDEITKLTAIPFGSTEEIALNPDIYYQMYSRLTYTRYKGNLTEKESEDLMAKSEAGDYVFRLEQTLTDGTVNYWEFYPISANRVGVVVKNGSKAEKGASFYIYGTALGDITNAYLHLMQGIPFDFEQRYD